MGSRNSKRGAHELRQVFMEEIARIEIFATFLGDKFWRSSHAPGIRRSRASPEGPKQFFWELSLGSQIATQRINNNKQTKCLEEEKEEKDLEREAPSVTAKFSVITSRVLPSPPSVVLLVVVVSSVSLV